MSTLVCLSLGIALSCGLFSLFCHFTGISIWMGFVACTSYFAAGGDGKNAAFKALASNYTGVAFAMLVITFRDTPLVQEGGILAPLLMALATAAISGAMVYLSKMALLSSIASTFMGCFSTFASGGNWQLMLPSLACGIVLGLCCDNAGKLIARYWGRKENNQGNISS